MVEGPVISSVDLEEFLRRRGEKLITSGRDKRLASDHSITIRGCEWFDHATEQGGRAISFVKQFYGLSYPDAMSLLLGDDLGGSYPAAKEKVQEPAKPFVLPPQSESMRRVYAYLLQKRCIGREILNAFVRKKLIYESCEKSRDGTKEYHNAVFVGFDEHGVPRHGHKRGLYTMGQGYRGNIEGSDPRHSFHYLGGDDTLYVFEAPIDLLSYISLFPEGWQEHNYVACCGTSSIPVLEMLRQLPQLQQVYLCLDNDAAGHAAGARMAKLLEERGISAERLVPNLLLTMWDTIKNSNIGILVAAGLGMFAVIGGLSMLSYHYTLSGIKSRTVGDGQHGTARWATDKEIRQTYAHVPFKVRDWRKGVSLPTEQGLVLGCKGKKDELTALVDSDDIHCLMIGASGVGKTAFFLYPNLEYACACGMSFLALDTKGDLARNYGAIASRYYGYRVSVIDLRNPTRSDGFNFLTLMNHYMDLARADPSNLAARAKAEKYAKILAKTIISPDGDASQYGDNAYFYDSAEGLLTAVVLLLAEFVPPKDGEPEKRHIVSAFKLVQDLLAMPSSRGRNGFQLLVDILPPEHKARWLAGAALTAADQAMASVMSTVLSRLNAFLDTELEQVICYDSPINAEMFASEKCAIFLILPEEDQTKNFMAGLMIQNLSRELFAVADENGGKLKNRVILFCDELGTMPPFDILPLFSAGRSRRLTLVPIIQSLAQLEKNYGKEGAEIICDNCQDTIFGGFSPQSKTAEALSAALGSRTVLSGSVSQGKESSQSLQMMERPLMTPDELKSIPKGEFVVMKTGTHPMRTRLRLFLDWGITFDPEGYRMPERAARKIAYVNRDELAHNIQNRRENSPYNTEDSK